MNSPNNLFLILWIMLISMLDFINTQEINPYLNKKINFTESTETINNPGAGYTTPFYLTIEKNKVKANNLIGNLVLMYIDIGAYSSGRNGEETDSDFDQKFFQTLRKNFDNCRKNGATFGLRFRYDSHEYENPEPKTFEKILNHIEQIKNNSVLEEYKDILMFVESGFVGKLGEQMSGKYCSLNNRTKLLDTLLDVVPDNISVSVRTPETIAKWLKTEEKKLEKYKSKKGSRESRVGIYNNGYMGSNTDLGTYKVDRGKSINFFSNQMKYAYFGGEFPENITNALLFSTYKPENAIKEMYKSHLSYINNIYPIYKNYTFGKEYNVKDVDNSAYYGQSVYKFIRDHVGYRLVLRKSSVPSKVEQGESFTIKFTIENTGFANPIRKMNSDLILEQNGTYMRTELDIDATEFYSCSEKTIELKIKIPGEINTGIWNIFLKIYVGKTDLNTYYMRSIKFANNDIYESNLGANYLGSIKVVESNDEETVTNKQFYQSNSKNKIKSDYKLYNISKKIKLDGFKSLYEWTDDLLLAQKDGKKLYATNDDQFLYVMAEINHNATDIAANIHIHNNDDNKNYTFYYCSNGAVVFSQKNYENWLYMNNGSIFEFKIPIGTVMNMTLGTKLKSIKVYIEDISSSWNNWINVGEIASGVYTLKKNTFNVFTAFRNVILKREDDYVMDIDTSLAKANYQWQLNGTNIKGANYSNYTIVNATDNDTGIYSVIITPEKGDKKTYNICTVNFFKKKKEKGGKSHAALVVIIILILIILIAVGVFIFFKWRKNNSNLLDKLMEEKVKMINPV